MVPDHGRKNPRFSAKLEVTLLGRTETKALVDNVSLGGLFLKMDSPPGKMQLIRMKMVLPTDNQELVVHGVGKHVVDRASGRPVTGVGVAFFGFDGPQFKRWEAYIQHVAQHATLAQASRRLLDHRPAVPQHGIPAGFDDQRTIPYQFVPQAGPLPPNGGAPRVAQAARPQASPLMPPVPPPRAKAPPPSPRRELMEIVLDEGDLEMA
ncbi:MAG TPA: PilZ domain-containing protein [Polyangiaceae bacterium]